MRLLLTVEDSFLLTGRGLVLAPEVPPGALGPARSGWCGPILLRRPDGSEARAEARFEVEHFWPGGYRWLCYPQGLGKGDVPVGTEVWLLVEEPADSDHRVDD